MGKVIQITEAQALQLAGKEYTKDMVFNPVQDAKWNWVISEEEIVQCQKSTYSFIKSVPLKEHEPKALIIDGKDGKVSLPK